MKLRSIVLVACALTTMSAFATQGTDYIIQVARLQGNIACTVGLADKSFDCTVHAAGKGVMDINMSTLKNKAGDVVGFFGLDQLTENGVNYTMIVMANENQGIKGISMVTDTQGNKSGAFDATMVSTSASELQAVNISPLAVDVSDSSAIKISLGFSIYAKPQAVIMQSNNSQDIINLLMDRLQPYILSLKK